MGVTDVSRIYPGGWRVFPKCFKGGSRNFQENILGVLKNFHDAWHSSQLLEQKEGLFIRMIKEYII